MQDILEKVPEEEETILIDSEGRWHTPNGKFSSDEPITNTKVATLPSREASTVQPVENKGFIEPNAALPELKMETSIPSPPLAKPSRKLAVEVFEIDDDDESPEDKTTDSEKLQSVSESTLQSSPITPAALSSRPQQTLPPATILGNGNYQNHGRESQSADERLNAEGAVHPFQPPTMGQPVQKSSSIVIDLTLSDSEEDEMPAPPRRRTSAVPNQAREESSSARPSNMTNGASSLIRKSTTPILHRNGSQAKENGSSVEGSSHPSYNGWRPIHVNTNGNHTHESHSQTPATTPLIPARRPRLHIEEEQEAEDEDEEGDESQPVIAHRKKSRRANAAVVDYDEEEADWPFRPSSSENSDELFEEERAGLAVGR